MTQALRAIQPTYREHTHRHGVGAGTLLLYGESDVFLQAVAPILADIVRAVEEEAFLQLVEQKSRAGTRYSTPDTAPRQRARYAFD